jgi:signal peptidase I
MLPTLRIAQIVAVDTGAVSDHQPAVGDIVVFHPPIGATRADGVCGNPDQGAGHPEACGLPTPQRSSATFIKRVVAGPGDRISIVNGHAVRNGVQEKDSYITPCPGGTGSCSFPKTIVIPPGDYFLLGDNRGESDDSRFWGPIKRSWIIGLVHTP